MRPGAIMLLAWGCGRNFKACCNGTGPAWVGRSFACRLSRWRCGRGGKACACGATVNGVAVRTSLFRTRDGGCILLVNKQTQKRAGITLGSVAEVVLEPDTEERPAPGTPVELEKLLRQDRALRQVARRAEPVDPEIHCRRDQPAEERGRARGPGRAGRRAHDAGHGGRKGDTADSGGDVQPESAGAGRMARDDADPAPGTFAGDFLLPEPGIAAKASTAGD